MTDVIRRSLGSSNFALVASDLERLSDFYRQPERGASPPSTDLDTGLRSCVLDFGIRLEVFERRGSGEGVTDDEGSPGLLHLGFALESADAVDELTGVIAAAGYRVIQPPRRARARPLRERRSRSRRQPPALTV